MQTLTKTCISFLERCFVVLIGVVAVSCLLEKCSQNQPTGLFDKGTHTCTITLPRTDHQHPESNEARLAVSHILFVNRCPNGCTVEPTVGLEDDSRDNLSSLLFKTIELPPYPFGDKSWRQVMDCLVEIYAPFHVIVTDIDPGNAPHFEVMVAGDSVDASFGPGYGGMAPFRCTGVVQNAITFTFPEVIGDEPRRICEIAAGEAAHAFGLDHAYLCEDVMSKLSGCDEKSFRDQDAACGEGTPRPFCACGSVTQNSYRRLLEIFGPAPRRERKKPGEIL